MMNRLAWTILLVLALGILGGCPRSSSNGGAAGPFVPDDPALVEANNRGVGLMGQFDYDAAHDVFKELADAHPKWFDVRVNLAIATLNRQKEGDEERASNLLNSVLADDPQNLRAMYCLALLRSRAGDTAAVTMYQQVAESDPSDAYAAYYYASALESAGRGPEALEWYERAIDLDPYLRSSYYRASQLLLRSGRRDEGMKLLEQFQKLDGNPRAVTTDTVYTKMGPKAEVLAIDLPGRAPVPPPVGPVFAEPRSLIEDASFAWNDEPSDHLASITACDLDQDGDVDLFIADALRHDAARNAVLINDGDGRFRLDAVHPLAGIDSVHAALWGDYDNDGRTDVYLCRTGPNQLWRQSAAGRWEDVTDSTGTANGTLDTVDGAFVDADHDGDLDLFCVNANGPNELLNNNLDGTFRPIAAAQGIAGDGSGSRQVLFADLDHDRDLDIMVINQRPPHEAYMNDRLWSYRAAQDLEPLLATSIAALAIADLDADGQSDLLALGADGVTTRWRPGEDSAWRSEPYAAGSEAAGSGPGMLAVADVDGDGQPDLLRLWNGRWGLAGPAVEPRERGPRLRGLATVLLDPARGPAVVGWAAGEPPRLWGPGPGRHGFASIMLTGKEDAGQSMRSNASGIGAHVTARIDSTWTLVSTLRSGSGPGQSLQPLALGLGGQRKIDFVAIDWSDGLFQSELDLEAGTLHRIAETQRQVSSCPVLFAWNGERYEFVSDLLGVGGIGYMVAPGEYAQPRPWENFLLPEGLLQPRDGRYDLRLGEPMEEACYLDAAALVAYDLPPGWRMTLDERMQIAGPTPTGEPRFYREIATPVRAVNDRGEDVTDAVALADLRAAPVGELDHRFIGRLAQEHVLTVEFDRPLDAGPGTPMLVADGWIEYPYSQTMFASWQAGAAYRAPTIEARDTGGHWTVLLEQFGYPAGMPRQMSIPLDDLPPGCTALRISTNQEIYWDRLFVAWAEECPDVRRVVLSLDGAAVRRSGFARRSTGPQRLPRYDYQNPTPVWDTRHQRGFYTAFGPATELVAARDDGLAIFGPGEEVALWFNAAGAELPMGWTRQFVLETAGWCKDMDLFTGDGETVGPVPAANDPPGPGRALHDRYNTRHEAGR